MRALLVLGCVLGLGGLSLGRSRGPAMTRWHVEGEGDIYDNEVFRLGGESESLENYQGKVLLVVNVASLWGYVWQYKDFNHLLDKYGKRGLRILAFPSNSFRQEPRKGLRILDHIKERLERKCGVQDWTPHKYLHFFAREPVNGPRANPLYQQLKTVCPLSQSPSQETAEENRIRWNFEKFLVDRRGSVRYRFKSGAWNSGKFLKYYIKELLDEEDPYIEYLF